MAGICRPTRNTSLSFGSIARAENYIGLADEIVPIERVDRTFFKWHDRGARAVDVG
jgi:hypothetical protein